MAAIGRVCKRYVYSGRDWSKELLEANEPKSRYCSNEYGSHAEFVIERSHDPILSHHRLAVSYLSKSVEKESRTRTSKTESA